MIKVELHIGQDMPELKPAETGPLAPQTTGVASLVIEAGTIRGENKRSPLEAHEFSRGIMSLGPVGCMIQAMRESLPSQNRSDRNVRFGDVLTSHVSRFRRALHTFKYKKYMSYNDD